MTGFDSKRQAAQDKMELADAYASAVAATPHMPTPLERNIAVERIERARNALEAALEQQQAKPTCPDCKAAVLYECVACSSNNYPPKQQAEPPQRPWVGLTDEEILSTDPWEILRADPWMGTSDSNINPYQILLKVRTLEAKLKERNT